MKRLAALALGGSVVLTACAFVAPPERLVLDFRAAGIPADLGTPFQDVLLGGQGTVVCVRDESIQVYVFPDIDAAIDAAATINRDDPSNIGNGLVEWVGPPRFWIRDRAIIQYVGFEPNLDAALRAVLGQPFAETEDAGRGAPGNRPPCQRAG